jgi:hypothetical protein
MLDVNIDAVIATMTGSQEVENVLPFLVPEKGILTVNLRADHRGYLELQVVTGAPVFLYRGGNLTAKEIEGLITAATPNFDLAAAIGQSARVQMEASMGMVTLFSEKNSMGFLRSCQYPYPPYNTQAKLA